MSVQTAFKKCLNNVYNYFDIYIKQSMKQYAPGNFILFLIIIIIYSLLVEMRYILIVLAASG